MSGHTNLPTKKRALQALLKKLEHDPEALELVAQLIERLAAPRALPSIRRRPIQSK